MTRAFEDIEAVTRLLEEKEKDLELTVQIGKELLMQNNALENKILDLEVDLKTLNEERSQLLHELHKKVQLIAILTSDADDNSEHDSTVYKISTIDLLQKKVMTLQDENKLLKLEASELACQTDEVEDQERKLMEDITTQLNITNNQYEHLNLELERQKEENRIQYEQIVSLAAQLTEEELRLHRLTEENQENIKLLNITKANQDFLASELSELKRRYQEVICLLQETQQQLRMQQKKIPVRSSFVSSITTSHKDSLHNELMELSLFSEQSIDSGISGEKSCVVSNCITAFGNNTNKGSVEKTFEMLQFVPWKGLSSSYSFTEWGKNSKNNIFNTKSPSIQFRSNKESESESLTMSVTDDDYPSQPSGIPGAPGARDLEAALKRLTPAEIFKKRASLLKISAETFPSNENLAFAPIEIGSPDSALSFNFPSICTTYSASSNHWLCPQKLQIIKPIEGSQTLNHWSKLATPTLSGLLEERPGVTIRGGRGLDELGMHTYSLSDVEEDCEDLPRKQYEASGCIYTYTNSTVMHPADEIINNLPCLPISHLPSLMASASTSRQPSGLSTPKTGLSRRNSCSTFSVHVGIAAMLNERGSNTITNSLNTSEMNFTPIFTPCNSLEGSPTHSPSSPLNDRSFFENELPTKDSSYLNLTPRKQQISLTNLEKRALRSLKLVEKVESVGLENIITIQPNTIQSANSSFKRQSGDLKTNDDKTSLSYKHSKHGMTKARLKQPSQQKYRRNSNDNMGKRFRTDLGIVNLGEDSPPIKKEYDTKTDGESTSNDKEIVTRSSNITQSVVGSINALLFGRKGGWL